MHLNICTSPAELSLNAAHRVAALVNAKPSAVLCLASGHTPLETYSRLASMAQAGEVDFSKCHFIGLDEWIGIPSSAEGSCRYLLEHFFLKKIKILREQLHFFNGMATHPETECQKMDHTIARLGGLDLMLVGIGLNGHLALNEPGAPWHLRSHVSLLEETTASTGQKYFSKEVRLEQGITLGLQYLREARLPLLLASGSGKAAVIRRALSGKVTTLVPASIFQVLEHGVVLLDEDAAAELNFT